MSDMQLDTRSFAGTLRQRLVKTRSSIAERVVGGKMPTDEYRFMAGKIAGIDHACAEIDAIAKDRFETDEAA